METGSQGKKGKTIHSEARNIIANVILKCDEEALNNQQKFPLKQATERAAYYVSRSIGTIKNIRKEVSVTTNTSLSTPGKKRKRPEYRNASLDDFDKCVVRNVVMDFYVREKRVPSLRTLLPIVREKIDFPWKKESLRRILHEIGFKWRKCSNKRKILIERPDIVNWRVKYLRAIKKCRNENKTIFYMDESWIDSNLTFKKCWQSCEITGVLDNNKGDKRLVIVHVGSKDGFLDGAELVFKAGVATGDYHGQMNQANFEKWVNEKLLPRLPPNSILVMDNAPYHNTQIDKPPTKSDVKQKMIKWLEQKGVKIDTNMRKVDLLELINKHKPPEKIFKIDSLLKHHGHDVLRLPPYMCDINPIELAWAKVKRYVRERNVTGELCMTKLLELTMSAINSVTKQDWSGFVKHVQKVEDEYWKKDGILEDTIDSIIVSLGQESDDSDVSEDCSPESGSESDSELASFL